MRVAQKVAGYTLAEADNLRKACGKKDRELIAKERVKFVEGCDAHGYGSELGTTLFNIIEPFADYAFNKSHAYGYGLVAYQTAYLKAHYGVEYLAALLTSVKSSLEKAAVYLNECRQRGIPVLVPDVNVSASDFTALVDRVGPATEDGGPPTPMPDAIPFGLSAIRNVGEGLVALIIEEREAAGPFADFYDFCERVDTAVLNKRTIESLVKAGAFDSLGHPRRGLLSVFERIVDVTVARRRERDMGVMTLFGEAADEGGPTFEERPRIPDLEFDKRQQLAFEKEMLGLYVSDHPLMGAEASLRRRTDGTLDELADLDDGTMRVFGGVVTALAKKWTKKGDLMAVFTLEDLRSSAEVMVFPKSMQEHGHKLADDVVVCVRGRVDKRDDAPKIIAMDIDVFEPTTTAPAVRIALTTPGLHPDLINRLKALLRDHPGESEVFIRLSERQTVRLPPEFCVDASNTLLAELRVMLGPDAVII